MHLRDTSFSLIAALLLSSSSATAASVVYVVNDNSQFGTLNLTTGSFTQIGPATPEGENGAGSRTEWITINTDLLRQAGLNQSSYRSHDRYRTDWPGGLYYADIALRAHIGQRPGLFERKDLCD